MLIEVAAVFVASAGFTIKLTKLQLRALRKRGLRAQWLLIMNEFSTECC